jgi:hypothetical protein
VPPVASRNTINWEAPTIAVGQQLPEPPASDFDFDNESTVVGSSLDLSKTLPPDAPEEPALDLDLSFETLPVQTEESDAGSLFETAPAARAVPTPPGLDLNADLGFGVSTSVTPPPAPPAGPAEEDVDSMAFLADPTGEGAVQAKQPRSPSPDALESNLDLPPGAAPEAGPDGLEVLDFIDHAAPAPSATRSAGAAGNRWGPTTKRPWCRCSARASSSATRRSAATATAGW